MCLLCRSIEPELYPRPDGTVYVCGEPAAVPVPAGGPAEVSLEKPALAVLQVSEVLSRARKLESNCTAGFCRGEVSMVQQGHVCCVLCCVGVNRVSLAPLRPACQERLLRLSRHATYPFRVTGCR
jgi:hypothetical protein